MTVADYTDTPFARVPRLHHKDALAGPSSAGLARRNLVGMMGVMMAMAKGSEMKTVTAISGNNLGTASSIPSCFVELSPWCYYVLKSPVDGRKNYQCVMFMTGEDGEIYGNTVRIGYASQETMQWNAATWGGTVNINSGDEFYELDVSAWRFGS